MFGLAAHSLIAVLARAFYARQDTRTPVAAGLVAVVVNTILSILLAPRIGLPGSAWRSRSGPGWRWRSCSCCFGGGLRSCRSARSSSSRSARSLRRSSPRASRLPFTAAWCSSARRIPACSGSLVRITVVGGAGLGVYAGTAALPCASRSCHLSSGSWPTCSDARAEREPAAGRTRSRRSDGLGRVRLERRTRLVSPALAVGPGQGRQRLVGGPARGGRDGRRCPTNRCAGPRPASATTAVGLRLRPPRPGRDRLVGRLRSPLSPTAFGRRSRRGPAACPMSGSTPRSSTTGRMTRMAPSAGPSGRPTFGPASPIQPNATRIIDLRADEEALWGDLRKKWRQYVNKARKAGIVVVDADGDRLRRVLRDLSRDRRSGGLPHPHRAGLPRRLGGLPAARPRPAPVRPDRGRASRWRRSSSSGAGRASSSRTAG